MASFLLPKKTKSAPLRASYPMCSFARPERRSNESLMSIGSSAM